MSSSEQGELSKALSSGEGVYKHELIVFSGSPNKIYGVEDHWILQNNQLKTKQVVSFNDFKWSDGDNQSGLIIQSNSEVMYSSTTNTDPSNAYKMAATIKKDVKNEMTYAHQYVGGQYYGLTKWIYSMESLIDKPLVYALNEESRADIQNNDVPLEGRFGNGALGYKISNIDILESYADMTKETTKTLSQWSTQQSNNPYCKKTPDIELNKRILVAYTCDDYVSVATMVGDVLYTGDYRQQGRYNGELWLLNKTAANTLKTAIEAFNATSCFGSTSFC